MLNKKIFTLPAIGLLLSLQAFSQGQTMGGGGADPKLNAAAPSNMSIGNLFSPSLYNGTANINIPIYDYGEYGISLSYNTAGIKVNEVANSVGLHWNMNAGGSIVRMMKDVPDEMNSDIHPPSNTMGTNPPPPPAEEFYTAGIKGKFAQYFGQTPPNANPNRYVDGESDDFMFSVGGLSFTFNIGANGFVFTHPHKNVKIEILLNGVAVTEIPAYVNTIYADANESLSFKVTDAQGTQYYFEKGDVTKQAFYYGSRTFSDLALEFNYISKWNIQKIVRIDGSEINFLYTAENTWSPRGPMFNTYTGLETDQAQVVSGQQVSIGEGLFSSNHLSSIQYPNNVTATFVYNELYRCDNHKDSILKEINISSGDKCNRYVMKQVYSMAGGSPASVGIERAITSPCASIGPNLTPELYHRLILKGIEMQNCADPVSEPYYTFEYDPVRLPNRSSGSQDYFGYYNGAQIAQPNNGGELNVPYHTPKYGPSTPYGAPKEYNADFAQAGLLTTVKNAYGGVLNIGYEANILSNFHPMALPSSDPLFMGKDANDGVRVQFMTSSDVHYPGKAVTQYYTYDGGQRFLTGGYFNYPLWAGAANTLFCGSYVSPHQLVNGSNHGYSFVSVVTKNQSNEILSKKDITFSNFYTSAFGTDAYAYYKIGKHYYEVPYTDKQYIKDWQLGLPLTVVEYDQNLLIKTRTENTYALSLNTSSTIPTIGNTKKLHVITDANEKQLVDYDNYRPYTGIALLSKTVVQKYTSNTNYINDEVNYTYDDSSNIATITTRNSRGEEGFVRNVYNYSVSGPGVTGGNQTGTTLYNMTVAGLEKLVSTERWKKGSSVYDNQLLDASITKYTYNNNKLRTETLFNLQSLAPVSYTSYTGIPAGTPVGTVNPYGKVMSVYNTTTAPSGFQEVNTVLQTDAKGHATEMKQMGQSVYTSMIWDRDGNMAAVVNNARLKDIGFTSFEGIPEGSSTGNANVEDGGFTYKYVGAIPGIPSSVSGGRVYSLSPASYIRSPRLTAGTQYVMTLWSNGAAPAVSGAGISLVFNPEYTNGDWTFYKAVFTPTLGDLLNFSSPTTIRLDEIRMFPVGAQMKNSVYAPMLGITSSTDPSGRITYFEYDSFGRQDITRDQEKNIISKKEYHLGQ